MKTMNASIGKEWKVIKKWLCFSLFILVMVTGTAAAYAAANESEVDQKTIDECSKAMMDSPNNPALYVERGRAYRNSQQTELAITDFTRAIEVSPQYVPAYSERALTYYEGKNYEAAWNDYDSIIKLDSENADAYFRRGACYYYKHEFEAAVQDLDQASKLRPQHPGAYLVKGVCYQKLDRSQDAVAAYKELLAHVPAQEKEAIELAKKLLKSLDNKN